MATVTIEVPQDSQAFSADELRAISEATAVWEATIANDVAIKVGIAKHELLRSMNLTAVCVPNLVQGILRRGQSAMPTTLTTAQNKVLQMNPVDADALDIVVVFDGLPRNTFAEPTGHTHLATEMLHEICHGLGFLSLTNLHPSGVAVHSDPNLLNVLGDLQSLLPFYGDLQRCEAGFPTLFCQSFVESVTKKPVTTMTPAMAGALYQRPKSMKFGTTNTPVFSVDQRHPYMRKFTPFSSCDHIDEQASLMYWTVSNAVKPLDPATKGILAMIGWEIR